MKKIMFTLLLSSIALTSHSIVLVGADNYTTVSSDSKQNIDDWGNLPTFTGYEYDGLPAELVVGQTGQIKRPKDHYLAKTKHSFILESSDSTILKFSDNGEWIALKSGIVKVKFHVSDPDVNEKFRQELKQLGLSESWVIKEIYMEPITVTVKEPGKNEIRKHDMYRLYNPNSGEHFYTVALGEKNYLVSVGWRYEGIGWKAPSNGDTVYRLYNPNNGDHHYTVSRGEHDYLVKVGWLSEGVGWQSGGSIPVYRVYNPNTSGAGSHHYTTAKGEADYLVSIGWRYEGIGWYAEN